jgi:hypothetical protein
MAQIVGVHGIAQQFRGGYQLGAVWFNAVRDGLVAAGHQNTAAALVPDDVRVAFFGDLFRSAGAMAVQGLPVSAASVRPGLERDLLVEFYSAAVAQNSSIGPPPGAMAAGKAGVQKMLAGLAQSRTFAPVTKRALVGDLRQVTRFLTNTKVKQDVLARVTGLLDESTRVLIGHSLGSVVAYEYLCRFQPPSVELLVTLGSPLGIPNLVFDRLTPAPVGGRGAWPGVVANWVNVADRDDIVALQKKLAGLFPGSSPGRAVDDRAVDNGDEPHAIDRYLNTQETGSALGDVLG